MKTKIELLCPAGTFEDFKTAVYSGADAIYLATESFGARAYAKNFTISELESALTIAHTLGKKIYVTVNTIIKSIELENAKKLVDTLYHMGVDGLILADYALVNYVINNCKGMEAHISTQMGVKDLEDVIFFQGKKADRVVIARETDIQEITKIKKSTSIPLEVFIHGSLCVSYSGGCLMSSLLTLRSGNRGRCSQLCRKEYTLLKDGSPLSKEGFLLSMKDLNTSLSLGQLLDLGIDSLKIEGRMKNSDYVKRVTESYRGIIDHYPQKFEVNLESIFHRSYTKGFLFNEDKGKIVNTIKQNNLGEAIGFVDKYKDNQIYVKLMKPLHLKDRIRIDDKEETYFSIDVMYDAAKTSISEAKNFCVLNVRTQITPGSKIYRTIDSQLDLTLDDTYKLPITIYAKGRLNEPLSLVAYDGNNYFDEQSDECFQKALKAPLTKEAIFNQINKLKDTPLKIDEFTLDLEGELFMSVKGINEVRRKLIDKIIESHQFSRENKEPITLEPFFFQKENSQLAVYAESKEQYDVAKEMGVKTIYYENVSPYVGSHYPKVEGPILIGSYGGIAHYSGQEQILDSSFNISNEEACYHLYKDGASRVTLSQELSISEISALYNNYVKKFGGSPNLEIIAYGQMKLMTTKYCPLASLKQCSQCHEHHYSLKDEYTEFPLKSTNCMMGLYNLKPLNLIDELYEINKYANVIRLNFTFENKDETRKVIAMFQEKMENYERTNLFQKDKETHGYYKRPIL